MKYAILFYGVICLLLVNAQEEFTLDSYISAVLENDFGIKIVRNQSVISKNENNLGNAGYLPRIGLEAEQNLTINTARQEFLSGQVNEADNAQNQSLNMAARLDWTFFDGFQMFARDQKLNLFEETAKINLNAEMEMKIYQASISFYTMLMLQEMNAIYEQSISLSTFRLEQIQSKLKNGAASELDLIQSKIDLIADSSTFRNNLRSMEMLKNQMNLLLARDPSTKLKVVGEFPQNNQRLNFDELKASAQSQNTAILLSKANLAIKEKEHKEVLGRFYPQLGLYASYNFGRSQNQVGFLLSNRAYGPSVGLTLRWDILDQMSRYQNLKNAKIHIENAHLEEEQQSLFVSSELRNAYTEYEWAHQNMSFEARNKIEMEEIAAITEKSFKFGKTTALELREIQFGIVNANSRLVVAQLEYITALMNISLMTGNFKSLIK
jgi:outer membrane protein